MTALNVRLYLAPNAWDEPAVWADLGTGEPEYVIGRHSIRAGLSGDALWSVITEQIPEATS